MTERERWIVYPLLFLALGSALRDKMLKQTSSDRILCQQLMVLDRNGQPAAVIEENRLQLLGASSQLGVQGAVQAHSVNADGLFQQGQPIVGSFQQLLQWMIQTGLVQPRPGAAAPQQAPAPETPAPPI